MFNDMCVCMYIYIYKYIYTHILNNGRLMMFLLALLRNVATSTPFPWIEPTCSSAGW